MMDYEYEIEDCDVLDKEALVVYREKRNEWLEIIYDDESSILKQLYGLVWERRAFNVINETWGIASSKYRIPHASQNSLLCELLLNGFVKSQILGIRKLSEHPYKDPKKQVNSLPRLVKEIKDSLYLITRENYVSYNGYPYDYEDIKTKDNLAFYEELARSGRPLWRSQSTKGPEAWGMSELAHKAFDKLSRVGDASLRKREDKICIEIVARLEKALVNIETDISNLRIQSNKFVAHAADKFSRDSGSVKNVAITLDQIDKIFKTFFSIVNFISAHVIYETYYPPLATPQYNVLEGLDKPWVNKKDLSYLEEKWREQDQLIEGWQNEYDNFSAALLK